MEDLINIIVCFLIAAACLFIIVWRIKYEFFTKPKQIRTARSNYNTALKSGNKVDALNKGRAYYSLLRNGDLTIYDEQAITNDLSTMKQL